MLVTNIVTNSCRIYSKSNIEIGTSDKIFWGCDTWTSEESFGARIALNNVLASVLSQK